MVCLHTPSGAGLAALNMVVAELGTQCYNFAVLQRFSALSASVYFVGMTLSNAVCARITMHLAALEDLGTPWVVTYSAMSFFLLLLRVVGEILFAQACFAGDPMQEKTPPSQKRVD